MGEVYAMSEIIYGYCLKERIARQVIGKTRRAEDRKETASSPIEFDNGIKICKDMRSGDFFGAYFGVQVSKCLGPIDLRELERKGRSCS